MVPTARCGRRSRPTRPNVPWARFGEPTIVDFDGNGTSAATPQVAAAAALWIENHRNDFDAYTEGWMRVEAVRKALFESAAKGAAAYADKLGDGMLRAADALSRAAAPAAAANCFAASHRRFRVPQPVARRRGPSDGRRLRNEIVDAGARGRPSRGQVRPRSPNGIADAGLAARVGRSNAREARPVEDFARRAREIRRFLAAASREAENRQTGHSLAGRRGNAEALPRTGSQTAGSRSAIPAPADLRLRPWPANGPHPVRRQRRDRDDAVGARSQAGADRRIPRGRGHRSREQGLLRAGRPR